MTALLARHQPVALALVCVVSSVLGGCARPEARTPRADATASGESWSTTELTSATAGGPEAPKVGKMQRDEETAPSDEPPLATEAGEPKRPERPAPRRGAFGTWK